MRNTLRRIVTCIFSALLTISSVMPIYANDEQPMAESLSTMNISVVGSGQVKVTENGNETVIATGNPFSKSFAEGTNVTIEAIANEGNVVANFTNNEVTVPEFVAEQNNLKIEYVTGAESSNFVITFKEVVTSEEQETNEKVDTEPIEETQEEEKEEITKKSDTNISLFNDSGGAGGGSGSGGDITTARVSWVIHDNNDDGLGLAGSEGSPNIEAVKSAIRGMGIGITEEMYPGTNYGTDAQISNSLSQAISQCRSNYIKMYGNDKEFTPRIVAVGVANSYDTYKQSWFYNATCSWYESDWQSSWNSASDNRNKSLYHNDYEYKVDTKFHNSDTSLTDFALSQLANRDNIRIIVLNEKQPMPATGNLTIEKSSSNPTISDNNNCYSLEGAEYGLYESEVNANNDANRVGTFTIKADGTANTIEGLKAKTYYLKETKAGKGYALDEKVYPVTVASGQTEIYRVKDNPQSDPVSIVLRKRDANTGKDVPQGDAKLHDAEFTVKYYKGDYAEGVDPATQGAKAERTWVLRTNEDGYTRLSDKYLVEGDELFYNTQGITTLPLGTVTIQETKEPKGYKLNNEVFVRKITSEGNLEGVETYQEPIVSEQVYTGEFDLIKTITDAEKSEIVIDEKGAEFVVVLKSDYEANGNDIQKALEYAKANRSETEYAVLKTNKNGYATSGKLAYGKYVIQQTQRGENAEETDMLDGIFTFEVYESNGKALVRGEDTKGNALEMGSDGKMHYHINNRPSDYYLKLVKKDAESGKMIVLSDATFKIKDQSTGEYVKQKVSGKWIDEFNTDKDGFVVLPLKMQAGKFTLEEIKAPNLYLLNDESIPFEIKRDQVSVSDQDEDAYIVVEMSDQRVKGSISFEKRGEVLTGAHKDENGNIVFEYEEVSMPDMEVTIYAKEDIVDPADGSVIYKAGDKVTTAVTGLDGKATINDLYLGKYTAKETKAPEGFVISDEEYDVTLSYKDDHTAIVSDSVTYQNDRQKVSVQVQKLDAETKTPLKGAKFGLYATRDIYAGVNTGIEPQGIRPEPLVKQGDLIETVVSDEEGNAAFTADLPLSQYEIREIEAPIGYASSDEVIQVDASYKGQDLAVIEVAAKFQNNQTQVEFSKVDASTGKELAGATQRVYPKDAPGEVFETWVSTNEPHIVRGLEVGKTYVWEEISAPYGFALAEKIEFTVEDTGEVQVVGTMRDEIVYGQLEFVKRGDQFTHTDIGATEVGVVNTPVFEEMNILGAEITIYAAEDITLGNGITYYEKDAAIEVLTSDLEEVQSIKLPVGQYYYVETKAPIGFVQDTEKHYFEIEDNQSAQLQVIESTLNNERPKYEIDFTKTMEFSDTAMNKDAYKDVVFGIFTRDDTYDWQGNVAIEPDTLLATTGIDEEGHLINVPELPVGNYYLKELATNSAYKLDENEYDFSIDQSNEETVKVVVNDGKPVENKLKEYYVLVNKVDENTMKNITSKEFEFSSFTDPKCKNLIETKNGDTENGTVKFVLNYGKTYIKETKAPQGYSLSPEVVEVEVNDDGLFVNGKKVEHDEDLLYSIIYKDSLLPIIQTGVMSNNGLLIAGGIGIALALGGFGILQYRKRKTNK